MFENPHVDFHAFAPLIVLSAAIVVVLLADLIWPERHAFTSSRIASIVRAGHVDPGDHARGRRHRPRRLFGGAFVVDPYSLAFDGFFLVVTYIVLLVSTDYISDGDYYQGEFYFLMLTSLLGLIAMASARDLISIFVALETITIPTFILAGWRKHDDEVERGGDQVLPDRRALDRDHALRHVARLRRHRQHVALRHRARTSTSSAPSPLVAVAIFMTIAGFAFKVSAVPFHFWAPDTYEGSPTPVTTYLSVASKAGGFVALLTIIKFGFFPSQDSWEPVLWVLAAASMIFGNLVALRQTNIVRMLAYSSIAQGGFILVPLAVAGDGHAAAVVVRSGRSSTSSSTAR